MRHLGDFVKELVLRREYLIAIVLFFLGTALFLSTQFWPAISVTEESSRKESSEEPKPDVVFVHVAGCVEKPGVYSFSTTALVVDAINRAGPRPDAYLDYLNLAQRLRDGMKIYVPSREEVSSGTLENWADNQKINLNTCSAADLVKIPGIGEKTAEKIIKLREKKGGFQSVDELLEVGGIGEKKLQEISEYVFVP